MNSITHNTLGTSTITINYMPAAPVPAPVALGAAALVAGIAANAGDIAIVVPTNSSFDMTSINWLIVTNGNLTLVSNDVPIGNIHVGNATLNLTHNGKDQMTGTCSFVVDSFGRTGEYTLNSDSGFDIKFSFNGSEYKIQTESTVINLNLATADWLANLAEVSNVYSAFFLNTDAFVKNVLNNCSASDLRKIQTIDKELIKAFVKSNNPINSHPEIIDTEIYLKDYANSIYAKVRATDAKFFEMNAVAHEIHAADPTDVCFLEWLPHNVLQEIFGFTSSADTGIAAEAFPQLAGAEAQEEKDGE